MEFTIRRKAFLDHLNLVSKGITPHSPIPVLGGILMQVQEKGMVLTGSDKEFVVRTILPSEEMEQEQNLESDTHLVIEQTGSMVVDSKILVELVSRVSGETIRVISTDGDLMRLVTEDGNFDLIGRPGSDYPDLALERPGTKLELPAKLLQDIFDQVSYAVSSKNSRQVLMGINLQIENGELAATATDSYRLARKVVPVDVELEEGQSIRITIPKEPFGKACSSFGSAETIKIYVDRRKIQFVFGHTLIQSQLYEGAFPDAARIIPVSYISNLRTPASDIKGMLSRTAVYTASTSQIGSIVPVEMNCSEEAGVGMRVLSSEIGSCKQRLTGSSYDGQDLRVSFNAKLMLDALQGLHASNDVILSFTGELRPIKITNPDDESLTMIVVPIRAS